MNNPQNIVGRLAPSPTGYLHLGNAWSFLLAWLSARFANGKIRLRIEDIDPSRSKQEFVEQIILDFEWLGIDYDDEIVFQSQRSEIYSEYIQKLSAFIYPCYCTRKELREMAGAPQITTPSNRIIMPDMGAVYKRTCRFLTNEEQVHKQNHNASLRLCCPPFAEQERKKIPMHFFQTSPFFSFSDLVMGKQEFDLNQCGGDFALRRSDNVWSYQLAVSIDDMLMGVNQVVRGNDILTSTPRQLYLFHLLDYPAPTYAHIPLLLDNSGDRLAKRHACLSLKSIKEKESSPAPLLQYLASFIGIKEEITSAGDILSCLRETNHTNFPWNKIRCLGETITVTYQ